MGPSSQQFPLSPDARRRLEGARLDLRAWLHIARADLADEPDPARKPVLRQRVADLEYVVERLERVLHPSNGGNQ